MDLKVAAERLRALHAGPEPLVLPNAWDAASARAVVEAGYPAVATSSVAVAHALGWEDGEQTPPDEMFAAIARIARAVDVPVTADIESGYGLAPEEVADRLLRAGAVGCNLEDTDHATHSLRDPNLQLERLAAFKEAARSAGVEVVLNARTDVFLRSAAAAAATAAANAVAAAAKTGGAPAAGATPTAGGAPAAGTTPTAGGTPAAGGTPTAGGASTGSGAAAGTGAPTGSGAPTPLDEAIRRGRLYLLAGADCVFPIGVADEPTIAALVDGIPSPINVIAGFRGAPGWQRLHELGVRRISYAGRLFRAMSADHQQRLLALRQGQEF